MCLQKQQPQQIQQQQMYQALHQSQGAVQYRALLQAQGTVQQMDQTLLQTEGTHQSLLPQEIVGDPCQTLHQEEISLAVYMDLDRVQNLTLLQIQEVDHKILMLMKDHGTLVKMKDHGTLIKMKNHEQIYRQEIHSVHQYIGNMIVLTKMVMVLQQVMLHQDLAKVRNRMKHFYQDILLYQIILLLPITVSFPLILPGLFPKEATL